MRRHTVALAAGIAAVSTLSALLATGVAATWSQATPAPRTAPAGRPAPSPATAAAPTPAPSATRGPVPARRLRAQLSRALDRYLRDRPGQVSLSIRDRPTGFTFTYAPKVRTGTASIVKVDILIALLLRARAADRGLTAAEKALAAQMIKFSDNKAADTLWYEIGGSAGLAAANRKLGLRDTVPSPVWGATATSAADQVRILRALTSATGPLTAGDRRYVLGLMQDVTPEQAWGVSAAARDRDPVALKNGWLPRPVDGGRWTINSIGRVRGAGHDFLIAVLSSRHPSMAAGIATVEHVAELVASAVSTSR
jgi:hypothetical protein